jgi:inorganic pyrophosphatase
VLHQIKHFYQHYKDLEENKWVEIEGWQGRDAACQEILASIERFNQAPVKPKF